MKVEIKDAKSIITKSNIPGVDFVINPYIGCQHGCIYCYAEFMIRFTGHKGERWGEFLDIKKFDWNKIKPHGYDGKRILLSSVTDPYLPLEKKYQNTRKILEKLKETNAEVIILTKSKLVSRDIDLFKMFENIKVGISLSTLDENFSRIIEPAASKPTDRLEALKQIYKEEINTWLFISPFFPEVTDYKAIIGETKEFINQFSFENLNFRPHNLPRIKKVIEEFYPELASKYEELRWDRTYWDILGSQIEKYCMKKNLNCTIEFHHGGFSKS